MKLRWSITGTKGKYQVSPVPSVMVLPVDHYPGSIRDFMKGWIDYLQPNGGKYPEDPVEWIIPNEEPNNALMMPCWDLSFFSSIKVTRGHGDTINEILLDVQSNPPNPELSFSMFDIAKRYANNKKLK